MTQDTLTLKSGTVLHLRPVKQGAIRSLLLQFGGRKIGAILENPDKAWKFSGNQLIKALEATEVLFSYCAAWGVTNDPPEDAMDELRALGLPADSAKVARANWLRFLEMEGDEEMGALIGLIMTLSFQDDEPEPEAEEDETATLKARIAELEAAATKGEEATVTDGS